MSNSEDNRFWIGDNKLPIQWVPPLDLLDLI